MNNSKSPVVILNITKVLFAAMIYKRINKCSVCVTMCRVTNQTRLLRNHDDVIVFITNIKRDVFAFDFAVFDSGLSGNVIAYSQFKTFRFGNTIY